jgi:pre-mRNA-splicing factor SYF1
LLPLLHQLWLELCELITKHPAEVMVERFDVDAILRGGIRKYKDEVRQGLCWCCCC